MLKVAFQGERGAYSEAAATGFFKESIETIPYPTFYDVLESTEIGICNYAVLPVENSLEGSVGESYDLLLTTKLNAVDEIYHKIRHCLIGFHGLENLSNNVLFCKRSLLRSEEHTSELQSLAYLVC